MTAPCGCALTGECFLPGGERIAVVLWSPNIREQSLIGLDQNWVNVADRWMQLSNFDDADLADGGKFISRWGDPIRSDPEPQKGFFMPWSAFDFFDDNKDAEKRPHDPQYVASARMPVRKSGKRSQFID